MKVITPRTHVLYGGFNKKTGNLDYIGRTSRFGTPDKALKQRLYDPTHKINVNDLEPRVLMTTGSKKALQVAEGGMIDKFKPRLNVDPGLGKSSRAQINKSLGKLDNYADEVANGSTCFSTSCPAANQILNGVLKRGGF